MYSKSVGVDYFTVFCSKPLYLEPCFWWSILVSWCVSTLFLNPIPTWASYITYQWHHLLISEKKVPNIWRIASTSRVFILRLVRLESILYSTSAGSHHVKLSPSSVPNISAVLRRVIFSDCFETKQRPENIWNWWKRLFDTVWTKRCRI